MSKLSKERWTEIERLLRATLEQQPRERAAFLTNACPATKSCKRCNRFLIRMKIPTVSRNACAEGGGPFAGDGEGVAHRGDD